MLNENDWSRIARYAAGEYAPEEATSLREWIESDPERQQALAFMRDVNGTAASSQPQWDTHASWQRFAARASARARRPLQFPYTVARSYTTSWRRVALRTAAVLAIAASGSLLWRWQDGRERVSSGQVAVAMREYATARGQRATLRLADGTRITLGVASKVRYAAAFGRAQRRDVYLEGEAYFDVSHDPKRPFVVHTAHSVTEDLGTKFNVRAYDTDTTVQVVVAEGSVELRAQNLAADRRGAVLNAGQLGQLAASGATLVRSDIDVANYLAWLDGRLVFEDAPLGEVLPQLARWYNLDFRLADSTLATRSLTASLGSEALSQSLELITSTLDIRHERHGRTITFLPRQRAQ